MRFALPMSSPQHTPWEYPPGDALPWALVAHLWRAHGWGPVHSLRSLGGGWIHRVYLVNEEYVLRFRPPERSGESLLTEEALTRLLEGRAPVPEIVRADTSRSLVNADYVVLRRLPGEPLARVWLYEESHARRREWVRRWVELLRTIHAVRLPACGGFRGGELVPAPSWRAYLGERIERRLARVRACPGADAALLDAIAGAWRRHAAALDLAEEILPYSPFGVVMTKEVMWANLSASSPETAIDLENRTQILASHSGDFVEAIRAFAARIGVARADNRVDVGLLDAAVRDELNTRAPRVLAVLRPLRVVLTNYPPAQVEHLDAPYWPHDVGKPGSRPVPLCRELYIERDDFAEHPPSGFHRLTPGGRVRLRHAYVIRCDEVVKDAAGQVVELRCRYDPDTLGRPPADGPVKGTIHWVSARHAVPAEIRLYDRLFRVPDPEAAGGEFTDHLNPASLTVVQGWVEPSVLGDPPDVRYQFERLGYFWQDPVDSRPDRLVFNRIVTLRDSWAKILRKLQHGGDEPHGIGGPAGL